MSANPEFDLAVSATEQGYSVALRAASGVELPPEPVQLAMQLPALPAYRDIARFVAAAREIRLGADTELYDAKRVGGALFNALFPREVLSRFRAARDILPFDGRLLVRLRLPPTLIGIPWELLYDAPNDQFLALADDLALVRCPEMANPLRPLQLTGPLHVVVVLASPRGARAIDLDRELARVQSALRRPVAEQRVEVHVIRGPGTLEQLRRQLAKPVHVLHILCHGDLDERRGESVLLFEDPSGDKDLISATQLRLLIEKQRGQTRLVVLNSCLGAVSGGNDPFGSVGAALMRGSVPAVVAMQFEIPAESAQELARIFYTDLADGRPIDMALTEARRHLYGYDSMRLDWAIPALFLRGNDGALFQTASAPIQSSPVSITEPSQLPAHAVEQEAQRLEELRRDNQRRLHILELQKAKFGISTPPEVEIEIQDIQRTLAAISAARTVPQSIDTPKLPASQTPSAPKAALSEIELRTLRVRARAAYYAPLRWTEAEQLLIQLAAAVPDDTEVRTRLQLLITYREIGELRDIGDWEAVLGLLDDSVRQQPGFADPKKHRTWAEAQQRRDITYEQALAACERNDWAAAQAALEVLLAEQPQDTDAEALLQRVHDEIAEQQRRSEAEIARQRDEQERQREAAEATAQKQVENARKRKAAEARARVIAPINNSLNKKAYADTLGQLSTLLKTNPSDREVLGLVAGLIENAVVPLKQRLQAGDLTGKYGDPRSGVVSFPPAMVDFAGGQFQYGNTQAEYEAIVHGEKAQEYERYAADWYKPTINAQSVTVAPFELARYLVTNAQWTLFMAAGGYHPDQPWWDAAGQAWLAHDDNMTAGIESYQKRDRKDQPSFWDDARFGKEQHNYPVVGINWYEAIAFCRWLTHHLNDGYTYILPSELEWEYAARGRERRMYAWGNQLLDGERANFDQTHQGTTAVGCFPAGTTPEGVLDMIGTVWEWTRSEYRAYPYVADDGRERGDTPAEKSLTLRGGGWDILPFYLRASPRGFNSPVSHDNNVGLRLARRPSRVNR